MEWGDLALTAQAEGSLAAAWKQFIKTKFFVSILRSQDNNPKNFLLYVPLSENAKVTVLISEVRDRLDPAQGDGIAPLLGADILARIQQGAAIQVLLPEGNFNISRKRVEWLRSGVYVTKTRIATRKELLAAAPAAPFPVLVVERTMPDRALPERQLDGQASKRLGRARLSLKWSEVFALIRSLYDWKVVASVAGFFALTGILIAVGTKDQPPEVSAPAATAAAPAVRVQAAPVNMGAPAAQPEPVVPFSPANNSFTVNLPGLAEEVELSPDQVSRLTDMESHQYRLQVGDRAYAMESAEYRESAPPDLNAAMDEVQRTVVGNGTLLSTKAVALRGATGREVRVRLDSGGERTARFVFIGKQYAMVMITVPANSGSMMHVDSFLNSFQLNSPPPTGM